MAGGDDESEPAPVDAIASALEWSPMSELELDSDECPDETSEFDTDADATLGG